MAASWRHYLRLHKKKARQEEQKCIVEGVRLCREALRSEWEIEVAFTTEEFTQSPHWTQFQDFFQHRKIPWRVIKEAYFQRLADTETPQGILLIVRTPRFSPERFNWDKAAFVVVLEGIRDPGNLGTLIRTADWFGANAVALSEDCVDPHNPKVLRASMGSIFHLPVFEIGDLTTAVPHLKEHHFYVVAATLNGRKVLHRTHFRKPIALILGSEAQGVSPAVEQMCDLTVRIWKYGEADSLNVGVAGGVLMHHIAMQIFSSTSKR
ncbi:MAG: RNA methyltransferase [Calditrichaeota bacterium]|nr:MAG: RNA methyltransferase [Calditrichota bacterium]